MKCQNCGNELTSNDLFCDNCGAKVSQSNESLENTAEIESDLIIKKTLNYCGNCGTEVGTETDFCGNCGFPLNLEAAKELEAREKIEEEKRKHKIIAAVSTIAAVLIILTCTVIGYKLYSQYFSPNNTEAAQSTAAPETTNVPASAAASEETAIPTAAVSPTAIPVQTTVPTANNTSARPTSPSNNANTQNNSSSKTASSSNSTSSGSTKSSGNTSSSGKTASSGGSSSGASSSVSSSSGDSSYVKSSSGGSSSVNSSSGRNDPYNSSMTYNRMPEIHNTTLVDDHTFNELKRVIEEFNAQCQAYMNEMTDEVPPYLKTGSTAYNQQINYKQKNPNLNQSYQTIDVINARQGGGYYYVWVTEVMNVTENGKDSVTTDHWVYKIDNELYICDYTKDPLY